MTEEKRDAEHEAYGAQKAKWEFMEDAIEGESAIKEKGETYLPKTPGMLSQDAQWQTALNEDGDGSGLALQNAARSRYENYKLRAEFPEKTGPACDAAVGFFTDKDAAVELPDGWDGVEENCTPDADTIWDLHRIVSTECVRMGRLAIWADVKEGDLPYYVVFRAPEVINWSETVIGNERVLDRVVFKVCDIRDGEEVYILTDAQLREGGVFVEKFIKKKDKEDEWEPLEASQPMTTRSDMGEGIVDEDTNKVAGFRLRRLPVQFINADGLKPAIGRIPFLPLASQCLKVYRQDANYQEALSFYEPTPFISGLTQQWIEAGYAPKFYGAGTIWYGPEGSAAEMVEYSGPSIANQRQAIQDALQRADELSMKPFEPKTVSVESGDAKKQRTKTQTSAAKVMAQNVGSGIQKIMRFSAEWLGKDPKKVVFEPSYDFIEAMMDGQTLTQFVAASAAGAFSKTTLHENLQRGGVTEKSFEEEQELIAKAL